MVTSIRSRIQSLIQSLLNELQKVIQSVAPPRGYPGILTFLLIFRWIVWIASALLVALYRGRSQRYELAPNWPQVWLFVTFIYVMWLMFVRADDKRRFLRLASVQVAADILIFAGLHTAVGDASGGIIFLCFLPFLIAVEFFSFRFVLLTLGGIWIAHGLSLALIQRLLQNTIDFENLLLILLPRMGLFTAIASVYLISNRLGDLVQKVSGRLDRQLGKHDLLMSDQHTAISEAVRSALSTDRQQAIDEILHRICEMLDCAVGTFHQYDAQIDPPSLGLAAAYGIGPDSEASIRELSLEDPESLVVKCFKKGPSLDVQDAQHHEKNTAYFENFLSKCGLRSMFAIQLMPQDKQPLGVVAFYRVTKRSFTPEEKQYGMLMSSLLALTVKYFDSLEETQSREHELEMSLAALKQFSREMSGDVARNRKTLLNFVARTIKDRLNVDVATVFLMDTDGCLKRVAMCGLDEAHYPEESYAIGEGVTGATFEKGEADISNNLGSDARLKPETYKFYNSVLRYGAQHQLTAPLRGQRGDFGVLCAHNKLDRQGRLSTRGFTEEDMRLMEIICSVAGLAIENIQPLEQANQRIDELAQLQEASDVFAPLLDTDRMIEQLVTTEKLQLADFVDVVWVKGRNEKGEMILDSSFQGTPDIPPLHERARPDGITRQAITSGKTYYEDDTLKTGEHNPYLLQHGIRSYVTVPLWVKDEVVGAIAFHSLRPGTFKNRLGLIEDYARRVAFAVRNTQVFERERRSNRHSQALLKIAEELNQSGERDQKLQVVADQLRDALDADGVGIVLFNPTGTQGVLQVRSPGLASTADQTGEVTLLLGDTAVQKALQAQAPISIYDAENDFLLESVRPAIRSWHIQSILIVPMIIKGRVIGTLGVDAAQSKRKFTQDEIEFSQRVATQAAQVIENARLDAGLRDQSERLRQYFNDMGSRLVANTDLHGLLTYIVHFGAEFLHAEDCSLYLINRDDNILELKASSRLPQSLFGINPMPISAEPRCGLTAYVAATGETLQFVGSAFKDHSAWRGDFTDHLQYFGNQTCVSLLIVPMLDKFNKIAGVLKVENKQEDESRSGFTDSDRELLNILARQVTIDIQSVNELQHARTEAISTERSRLLGALHDSMNDFHMGIMLEAELTRRQFNRGQLGQAQNSLDRLIAFSQSVYIDLKSLLEDLGDPIPILTSQGLEAALRRYASGALSQWINLEVRGTLDLLSIKQTINLFHIARGAISNSVKHSGLDSIHDRTIAIKLLCDGYRVTLQVQDNGAGFDVNEARQEQSRGLKRMQQLAAEINAQYEVISEEGVGTRVIAIVNLNSEEDMA